MPSIKVTQRGIRGLTLSQVPKKNLEVYNHDRRRLATVGLGSASLWEEWRYSLFFNMIIHYCLFYIHVIFMS